MNQITGKQDVLRPHIDTLSVVYGRAFVINPLQTRPLGVRRDEREDEPTPWLYLPAGRGE